MKNIAIIGHSLATVAFIETLLAGDFSGNITVFAQSSDAPCPRHRLPEGLTRQVVPVDLAAVNDAWFKERRVRLCSGKINRISFHRRWVAVDDEDGKGREQVPFDWIVLADTGQAQFPDLKGTNKQGNVSLTRMSDLRSALEILPFCDTVVVRGGGFHALKAACALREREKEVVWIIPKGSLFAAEGLNANGAILDWARQRGIRLMMDNDIVEVLGEKDVKAIRISSGKVLATQGIFWIGRGMPGEMDLRLFKDTDLLKDGAWTVRDDGSTALPEVFVLDRLAVHAAAAERIDDLVSDLSRDDILRQQGAALAARFLGQDVAPIPRRVARYSLVAGDVRWDGVGRFGAEEMRGVNSEDSGRMIWLADSRVQGALLRNATALADRLGELILSGAVLDAAQKEELGGVFVSGGEPESALQGSEDDGDAPQADAEESQVAATEVLDVPGPGDGPGGRALSPAIP